MQDLLQTIFGWVCGQNPGHTWAPGGLMLPCCQRCTGLYAGAFFAGCRASVTVSATRYKSPNHRVACTVLAFRDPAQTAVLRANVGGEVSGRTAA